MGTAEVAALSLEFSKRSIDGSGKATLTKSNRTSFGVVFEIDRVDLPELDRHEGMARGYRRDDNFKVTIKESRPIRTIAYLAERTEAQLKPYDWYLALVIAGAREHNLDWGYVARFREIAYDVDHDEDRLKRTQALDALRRSGFTDHREILAEG
jgi:hypothetical protein